MLGVVLIVAWTGFTRPEEGRGIVFGLVSGATYAIVAVGLRALREFDPIWLSAVNNLLGAAALGVWIVASGGSIEAPTAPQALALAAFGVVQMAIPYALFARGLRSVTAAEAGLITLLEPILIPVWVLIFHGERPSPQTLFGGACLLGGVAYRYWPSRTEPR